MNDEAEAGFLDDDDDDDGVFDAPPDPSLPPPSA